MMRDQLHRVAYNAAYITYKGAYEMLYKLSYDAATNACEAIRVQAPKMFSHYPITHKDIEEAIYTAMHDAHRGACHLFSDINDDATRAAISAAEYDMPGEIARTGAQT